MSEINLDKFKKSIANLKTQHEYLQEIKHDSNIKLTVRAAAQNSVAHCFIICFDTCHKMVRKYIFEQSGVDISAAPKAIFRAATENQLIAPDELQTWFDYTQARIDFTHDYSETKAEQALATVANFITDAEQLYQNMRDTQQWPPKQSLI